MDERRAELPNVSLVLVASQLGIFSGVSGGYKIPYNGYMRVNLKSGNASHTCGTLYPATQTRLTASGKATNSGEDIVPGRLYNLETMKLGGDFSNEHIHHGLDNWRQARQELLTAIEKNLAEMKPLPVNELYGSYGRELSFRFIKHIPE
ncbi:hypothetical protein EDD85DRAFT_798865 [Armillaria nabsnona]|nr:hypothetical protein EDD85DRAFT_798865 [Armillaria nabsnona]